jgi:signal transduction histidine kinase
MSFKADMSVAFFFISGIAGLLLSGAMLILLIGLTQPFRKLSAAAAEISSGDYNKRVNMRGNDEIAEFARSFNMMADSVQKHILELICLSESRERFVNNLSHELRTPIAAISGYAELLKVGNINEDERERSLDYIIEQSGRVLIMSHTLMELAQTSGAAIQKQPLRLEHIIENIALTYADRFRKKAIAFRTELQPVNIYGDAALIESLVQNLIENAVKASKHGGVVATGAYPNEEHGECVLWVSDEGCGMVPEEISKVAEPFYRIDKARSRHDGGAGLGLALCARICDVHGAKLDIISELGKGTTVKIYFTTS